jgi:hypothetical protein
VGPCGFKKACRAQNCRPRPSLLTIPKPPLFAGRSTLLSEMALPQRAGFPGSRAGLQKRRRVSGTKFFGRRRNRTPMGSIHGAQRISANPRMALDCVANSYTLRQSSQKPQPQSRGFRLDLLLTRKQIFCGHPSDERLTFLGNRATTTPVPLPTRPPRPVSTPAPTMPLQHRLGFHNEERTTPTTEPSAGNNPEPSVGVA